jgi:23S rRNA (guanosine2251-2'-O)-methyltransferase
LLISKGVYRIKKLKMQKTPNEALERLDVAGFKAAHKTPLIIVLDNIRSLNNIGSVFRTADAFLVSKIYLCGITAQPPHKDINKTALGATDTVAWEYRESTLELVKELQSQSIAVWSVEQAQGATFLDQMTLAPQKTYALIFGNEVKGVQQTVVNASDGVVEIPQFGTKHSLNISVSAGVVVWDFWKKLSAF